MVGWTAPIGGATTAFELTPLAPDLVERVLDGPPMAGLPQLMKSFTVKWERQREQFR